jgi:GPH family glycoside/pentoside/hexuronide:cation symporter
MKDQTTFHAIKKEDRLQFSQLAAYGAGGIIPIALFNVAGILVGLMGNISLGLSAFWLGAIMIVPRLWDALSDPIIGHLSDNTRTRWGRRRPFLLIGGLLVAVMFVVMWWIPKGDMVRTWFPSDSGYQWFQLSYILVTLLLFFTAVNIFEIPHGALGMEMTNDSHGRTRLFSAKSFVGSLFAMSTPWLFALANMEVFKGPGGNEADGMRYVSLMIAAIIIPLTFWSTIKLREPGFVKAAAHEKTPFWEDMKRTVTNRNFVMLTMTIFTLAMGFNFVQLLGSYIPIFYVFGGDKVAGARLLGINGTIWAITGLLAVFPLNWISPKMGKRSTLSIAIVLMVLAQLSKIVCYNPLHPYLIIIPTMLLSAGMLFFFTLGSSMVGDICDEEELKTGYRAEGSFYAIFWWFIKMGTALASFVAGALIVFTMFDQTQVTKVDSIQGDVREMLAEVKVWQKNPDSGTEAKDWMVIIKGQTDKALQESKDYLKYLDKESLKNQDENDKYLPVYPSMRKAMLLEAKTSTTSTVKGIEQLRSLLEQSGEQISAPRMDSLVKSAIPLTLQTKLEKAKMHSFELMSHLESRAAKNTNSTEHYQVIINNIKGINASISGMNTALSPDILQKELSVIESKMVPLTNQTPYTLLMMRVVEIGLPILLSLFSIFFLFRYTLTEKRSREIKNLLDQRKPELIKQPE